MSTPTVAQKVGMWAEAYSVLRDELTPVLFRAQQADLNRQEGGVMAALALSRMIFANDRAAMLAAAIITTYGGVRPVPTLEVESMNFGDES